MSKRDIVKTAQTNHLIPEAYQMSTEDVRTLYRLFTADDSTDNIWKLVDIVFRYGFVMGNRATISRNLKRL